MFFDRNIFRKAIVNKLQIPVLIAVLTFLFFGQAASAAGKPVVVGLHDNGGDPIVFVKGVQGKVKSADALIGNTVCEDVDCATVTGIDVPIKTLLLVDNSLSIPAEQKERINGLISGIIRSGNENNQYAYAKYGEDVVLDVGFTDNDKAIEKAVSKTETVDRETYLTDELYAVLNDETFFGKKDVSFDRIIVFSDGVDSNPLGITNSELMQSIETHHIPIYTVGVYNGIRSNAAELENMFSIARQSKGDAFLLDDIADDSQIVDSLSRDEKIKFFLVKTNDALKDGSLKTVTLNIETKKGKEKISVDNVRMAQVAEQKKEEPKPVQKPKAEPEEKAPGVTVFGIFIPWVALVIIGMAIMACLVLAGIFIREQKRKKREEEEIHEVDIPISEFKENDDAVTAFQNNEQEGEKTVFLFNAQEEGYIQLVDIANPYRTFKCPISEGQEVLIGRKQNSVNLCIDHDATISGKHCKMMKKNGKFYLTDLHSSNGTMVNDARVTDTIEVISGTNIKLGRTEFRVDFL